MSAEANAACRVKAGAEFLDRVRPGWAALIALDTLAMDDCDRCIFGQLYGGFEDGLEALNDRMSLGADDYGLDISHEEADGDWDEAYGRLAALWRAEVKVRISGEVANA
jgi:hypothetical protein